MTRTPTPPRAPEVATALAASRLHDEAQPMLVYRCATCKGSFDGGTVEAVLDRAAADTHGEAITPAIEAALAA
jgi:hypothetical protein